MLFRKIKRGNYNKSIDKFPSKYTVNNILSPEVSRQGKKFLDLIEQVNDELKETQTTLHEFYTIREKLIQEQKEQENIEPLFILPKCTGTVEVNKGVGAGDDVVIFRCGSAFEFKYTFKKVRRHIIDKSLKDTKDFYSPYSVNTLYKDMMSKIKSYLHTDYYEYNSDALIPITDTNAQDYIYYDVDLEIKIQNITHQPLEVYFIQLFDFIYEYTTTDNTPVGSALGWNTPSEQGVIPIDIRKHIGSVKLFETKTLTYNNLLSEFYEKLNLYNCYSIFTESLIDKTSHNNDILVNNPMIMESSIVQTYSLDDYVLLCNEDLHNGYYAVNRMNFYNEYYINAFINPLNILKYSFIAFIPKDNTSWVLSNIEELRNRCFVDEETPNQNLLAYGGALSYIYFKKFDYYSGDINNGIDISFEEELVSDITPTSASDLKFYTQKNDSIFCRKLFYINTITPAEVSGAYYYKDNGALQIIANNCIRSDNTLATFRRSLIGDRIFHEGEFPTESDIQLWVHYVYNTSRKNEIEQCLFGRSYNTNGIVSMYFDKENKCLVGRGKVDIFNYKGNIPLFDTYDTLMNANVNSYQDNINDIHLYPFNICNMNDPDVITYKIYPRSYVDGAGDSEWAYHIFVFSYTHV